MAAPAICRDRQAAVLQQESPGRHWKESSLSRQANHPTGCRAPRQEGEVGCAGGALGWEAVAAHTAWLSRAAGASQGSAVLKAAAENSCPAKCTGICGSGAEFLSAWLLGKGKAKPDLAGKGSARRDGGFQAGRALAVSSGALGESRLCGDRGVAARAGTHSTRRSRAPRLVPQPTQHPRPPGDPHGSWGAKCPQHRPAPSRGPTPSAPAPPLLPPAPLAPQAAPGPPPGLTDPGTWARPGLGALSRHGTAPIGTARHGSARYDAARLGTALLLSEPHGSAQPTPAPP